MESSSSSYGIEQLQKRCFHEWMSIQAKHIVDLKEALISQRNNDHHLQELVGKIVNDFQVYVEKRSELSHRCCAAYFAPSWHSPLENSLLWMGGCRPSSFIRLIYALCGSKAEAQLSKYLLNIDDENFDIDHDGSMSDLTATQLAKINELQMKVVKEEDKISKESANLQDDVSDIPIAAYATDVAVEADVEVGDVLDKHEERMAVVLVEADKLRFETLRKILEVVTPVQAAEFLLAGKKLRMSLQEWGRVREEVCARAPLPQEADPGTQTRTML
ncbi:Protein DOG1-like 3 [Cardamine amara subsp. amara]|uniref:Protein DOG1-like 3 n=1 Tax=Cardamine amara subsp. amara TaxID=228776 RepID=A0ABD1C5P9_CARAN